MNDTKNTFTVTTPRAGLTQFTFSNGYVLSVGCGAGHYASWVVGERFGPEGSQHFPTSFEVAVMDPNGDFLPINISDDVAGWQSLDIVQALKDKMGRDTFDPKDLHFFCN
tara:strand:+ start:498 stop:827 length:330 start_codon:yes stop_codon:yes gene_type:complete